MWGGLIWPVQALGGGGGEEGKGHMHAIHEVRQEAEAAECIAGTTALSAAVMQHKHAAVQLLLQSGAQVERTNKDGMTPIQLAQVSGAKAKKVV